MEPFPVRSRIRHRSLGDGVVVRYEEDTMVVLFDDGGYKTLAMDIIHEQGLIEPVV